MARVPICTAYAMPDGPAMIARCARALMIALAMASASMASAIAPVVTLESAAARRVPLPMGWSVQDTAHASVAVASACRAGRGRTATGARAPMIAQRTESVTMALVTVQMASKGRIVRFPMRQLAARAPCAACVRAWLSAPSCTSRTGPTPLTGATASARMHATEDAPTPQSSTEMALVSQATARRIDLTPRELRRLVHKDGCVGRESLTIASMARDGRRLRAGHLRSKWHGVRAEVLNDLVPRYFGAPWTDRQRCCCGVAADSVGRDC